MQEEITVDGVKVGTKIVEKGIEYLVDSPAIGKTQYVLSLHQILTRRFLEDQALKVLLADNLSSLMPKSQEEPTTPKQPIRIAEAG